MSDAGFINARDEGKEHAAVHSFGNSDAILCRNTAPLVALAYRLIGFKVGCKVLGREIGAALVTLIKKLNAKGVDSMLIKLDALTEREVAKAMSKGQEQKAEAAQDRQACIKAVVEALKETERTVPAVCAHASATALTYKLQAHEKACFYTGTKTRGEKVAFYFAVRIPNMQPTKRT